ncbi:MAG: three-Cys-motif partner protein TcmP [Candidatus Aerophobetes bacterium]|nr:three-Cys-motif partner protein TcmP [Candidatus Aerophobetes bacterium]
MVLKETIWPIEPHTQAKHAILDRYLKAWLPIMSSISGRIVYIDGFAGPGKYLDERGQPTIDGSPLIAINAARKHRLPLNAEILFLFIEAKHDRCEYLKNLLKSIDFPQNMRYEAIEGKFDETLSSLFDYLDKQKEYLAPAFAFIDPFGYSDTPFSLVKRIMKNPKCEVLINFMYHDINRFISDLNKAKHFDLLFGTEAWREIATLKDPQERKLKTLNLYQKELEEEAKIKYVRFFEMINKSNQTEYFLFFGTNNLEGLRQMNVAMRKVDPRGAFQFSDRTNPNQMVLFTPEPNYELLKKLIIREFSGKTVSVEEIDEFVLISGFTHFKRHILKPMEEAEEIGVVESRRKRKKSTYSPGTIIRFG